MCLDSHSSIPGLFFHDRFVPEYQVGTVSLLPQSILWLSVVFGAFLWIVAALGIWGASTNRDGKCLITCYMCVIFVSLCVQIATGTICFIKYRELKSGNSPLERMFVEELTNHPNDWVATENTLGCCGWYPEGHVYAPESKEEQLLFNEELMKPHGPGSLSEEEAVPCVQGKIYSCRATVMGKVQQYAMSMGIAGMTIVFVEFVCMFASCCLACCTPREDGGYSDDFDKYRCVACLHHYIGGGPPISHKEKKKRRATLSTAKGPAVGPH